MNANPHNNILAELGRLLIEAEISRQKKNTSSVSPAKTITEEVLNQRQQVKASVQSNDSQQP